MSWYTSWTMAGKQERQIDYQGQFRQARAEDLRFFRSSSPEALSEWFLNTFSRDKARYKSIDANHISPIDQIRILYDGSDAKTRKKIQKAVVGAVAAWEPEANTASQIEQLAFGVTMTRAEGAIPLFIQKIDDGSIFRAEMKERKQVKSHLVGMLAGFAPNKEVKAAFDRWVQTRSLSPRLSGLLFIGRSICDPDNYPTYLRDFWKEQEKIPNYFQMRGFYFSLIHDQGIGVEAFIKGTRQFTPKERARLLKDLDTVHGLEASEKQGLLCIKDTEANKTYYCGSLSL